MRRAVSTGGFGCFGLWFDGVGQQRGGGAVRDEGLTDEPGLSGDEGGGELWGEFGGFGWPGPERGVMEAPLLFGWGMGGGLASMGTGELNAGTCIDTRTC